MQAETTRYCRCGGDIQLTFIGAVPVCASCRGRLGDAHAQRDKKNNQAPLTPAGVANAK
jgi:hypothetical protein